MALDTSIYERARRGIRNQYTGQSAANEMGRFVSQQRGARDISDYKRQFYRGYPSYAAGYGRRGAAGPGVQSGVYKQAMSNYLGDYTRNLGRAQNDYRYNQYQYGLNADQLRAQRNQGYADLEMQKAKDIAGVGSWLKQLKAIYGGL
jgi:hypothetical protein